MFKVTIFTQKGYIDVISYCDTVQQTITYIDREYEDNIGFKLRPMTIEELNSLRNRLCENKQDGKEKLLKISKAIEKQYNKEIALKNV